MRVGRGSPGHRQRRCSAGSSDACLGPVSSAAPPLPCAVALSSGAMPSVSARAFQIAFERTLTKGGRLPAGDVKALAGAAARIKDASEARAAAEVLALVKHDRLLDRDEVEPAR